MARRNRRCRTFKMRAASLGLAAMIAMIIAPWIVYSVLLMYTDQTGAQIRLLEREKRALAESLRRQTAEWNQIAEPRRLDEAIASRGLRLTFAPPERTASVAADGQLKMAPVVARALAAARMEREGSTQGTAQVKTRRTRK